MQFDRPAPAACDPSRFDVDLMLPIIGHVIHAGHMGRTTNGLPCRISRWLVATSPTVKSQVSLQKYSCTLFNLEIIVGLDILLLVWWPPIKLVQFPTTWSDWRSQKPVYKTLSSHLGSAAGCMEMSGPSRVLECGGLASCCHWQISLGAKCRNCLRDCLNSHPLPPSGLRCTSATVRPTRLPMQLSKTTCNNLLPAVLCLLQATCWSPPRAESAQKFHRLRIEFCPIARASLAILRF